MKPVQWEPLDELALILEPLDRHPGDFIRRPRVLIPAVDMYTEDDDVVVRAAIPGVDPRDIDLVVSGQVLTIRGTIRGTLTVEQIHVAREHYLCEIPRGSILRRLRLPCEVQGDQARAICDMGIVEIRLPKSHGLRPVSMKVRVNVASPR